MRGQRFRVTCYGVGAYSSAIFSVSLKRRDLNRKISNRRALARARNDFQTRATRSQAIEEAVLAPTSDDKQSSQFFSRDSCDGCKHVRIPFRQTVKNYVGH